jgi:hypothetical protein
MTLMVRNNIVRVREKIMKNMIAVVAVVLAASTLAQPATAGGGIIGLTAHGAQDVYLTGTPHHSYNRHHYNRHLHGAHSATGGGHGHNTHHLAQPQHGPHSNLQHFVD